MSGTYAGALTAMAGGTPEDEDDSTTTFVKSTAVEFEFDLDFQAKVAAMMLRDSSFMQMTDGLVKPDYFENAGIAALVRVGLDYFATYKRSPGDKTILKQVLANSIMKKRLTKDLAKLAIGEMEALMVADVSDREFVAESVAGFARHQAVIQAVSECVDLIEKKDFGPIEELVRTAVNIGVSKIGGSYNHAEMLAQRTQNRKDRAAGLMAPTGITTGYKVLDDYFYHKGWGRKEMAVLMGGPKAGKSMAMISFGINAALNGYTVLYVTLEVSKEIIAERIDANIAERAISELGDHPDEVEAAVKRFHAKAAPFVIEEFPTGTMRPSDLQRLIETHKAKGVVFDLVIVDYADLMVPERVLDNIQENSKRVYVGMRGIAMVEGFALLTATQTNREGAKKAVATMTDIAEDFNKVRIADVVISINATDEERARQEARLYFAASRNQRSGFSVRITQQVDQGKFIKEVIGED
jgi:replicative DNA helicase